MVDYLMLPPDERSEFDRDYEKRDVLLGLRYWIQVLEAEGGQGECGRPAKVSKREGKGT